MTQIKEKYTSGSETDTIYERLIQHLRETQSHSLYFFHINAFFLHTQLQLLIYVRVSLRFVFGNQFFSVIVT